MTRGELTYAIRQAHNNFDKWNNITGFFDKGSGYYYEILSVIEDSVKIGAKIASEGIDTSLQNITDWDKDEEEED